MEKFFDEWQQIQDDWADLVTNLDGYDKDTLLGMAKEFFNKRVIDYRLTKLEIVHDEFMWKVEPKPLREDEDDTFYMDRNRDEEYQPPKVKVDPNRWYTQTDLFFGPDGTDAPWLNEDYFREFGERLEDDDDYVMFQLYPDEYDAEDFVERPGDGPPIDFNRLLGYVQDWFQEYRTSTDSPVWLVDIKNVDFEWFFKLGETEDDPDEY